MAYNANIPQPTDLISQSQSDILGNFQAIQTLIDVNHYDFASGNAGKHMFVTLPVQGSSPVTAAGEVGIFSRTSSLTSLPELCVRFQSNGSVVEMTSASLLSTGWSFLPSGLLMKWGSASAGSIGSNTYTFPTGGSIPVFSNTFIVLLQPSSNTSAYVTAHTTTTFTYTATATGTFFYLVLGN